MQPATQLEDPYKVLGVDRTATPEAIKSAFRKQALRNHPDKNPGPEAAEAFKATAAAYTILSDPDKRRKYDAGGFSQLQPADFEVDLSSCGFVSTAIAALFHKLGVPIKTSVAPQLLEAAYEGRCNPQPLQFGSVQEGTVDKTAACFYEIRLSRQQIDGGIIFAAHSKIGSRFKLLLFERSPEGRWELAVQEDSTPATSSGSSRSSSNPLQTAGIYCLHFPVHSLGPRLTSLEAAKDPESVLFRRLETLQQRESVSMKPGTVMLAVQGDNWFKRVSFSLQVHSPFTRGLGSTVQALQASEQELLQERHALAEFERTYNQAKEAFKQACEKFTQKQESLQALLARREQAHQALLVPGSTPAEPGGPDTGHVS